MRYVVALVSAGLVIAGGLLSARQTLRGFDERVRDLLRQQKQAGEPRLQGVDVESMGINDVQMTLPTSDLYRLKLSQYVLRSWDVWAPAVLIVCLLAAFAVGLVRRKKSVGQVEARPTE